MSVNQSFKCSECKQAAKSVFCVLKPEELDLITSIKKEKIYEKGELIFHEGADAKGVYCVKLGKIKLSQLGLDGKDQILHLAKDGDLMGYRATLGSDVFNCSAIAIEKSCICYIPKDQFLSLVGNNSKIALQIIHLFSEELKKTESNVTKITQLKVKERIAQGLLLLIKNYGYEDDGQTINVKIKREELANMAGTTRETATRILYDFQKNNVIELIGKKIKIINLDFLKKHSNN